MNKLLKSRYYYRKDNRSIFQTNGHHHVLEGAPFYCEGGLVFAIFMDPYMMVA